MAATNNDSNHIPVIDLFAGPGGLGEGFSSFKNSLKHPFHIGLSVEMDAEAHRTLELRAFFRQFTKSEKSLPEDYYRYLRGILKREKLFGNYPAQAEAARAEACCAKLGQKGADEEKIREGIERALRKAKGKPWVLIGGPPCQAYSLIGRVRTGHTKGLDPSDERVSLYTHYKDIVGKYKPAVFVMENVKGLLSAKNEGRSIFRQIVDELTAPAAGVRYDIRSLVVPKQPSFLGEETPDLAGPECVIRMENYGIPQKRHRVILLGIRSDVAKKTGTVPVLKKKKPVAIEQVIRDLPKLRSGLSKENDGLWAETIRKIEGETWLKNAPQELRRVVCKVTQSPNRDIGRGRVFLHEQGIKCGFETRWYSDARIEGVCNHETRGHIAKDLSRYLFSACFAEVYDRSPKIDDFPDALLPEHRNVRANGSDRRARVDFADRFRVQVRDRPATTITSHISKDGHYYIHYDPSQCRSLTVREAARIQTFPDNYFFEGPRTSQYTQVGNAVPPLLARQIAGVVHEILIP